MERDADIEKLALSEFEKDGLQVFRNYQRAFDEHAEDRFAIAVDAEATDLGDLERILRLIQTEDVRAIPIIACAYADDMLEAALKAAVPAELPGGWRGLSGPNGPLSSLYGKIQICYLADICSHEILSDIERLRVIRNRIAHTWQHDTHNNHFTQAPIRNLSPIEEIMKTSPRIPGLTTEVLDSLAPSAIYRIRVGWVMARLYYEAKFYARARQSRLNPGSALYGKRRPKTLTKVVRVVCIHTMEVAGLPVPAYY